MYAIRSYYACKATDVSVGDLVRVSGTVSEYYNMTEITSVTAVTIVSSGNALPTPAAIALPVDALSDLEAFEGMRVTVTAQQGTLAVAENYQLGRYGQITIAAGGRITSYNVCYTKLLRNRYDPPLSDHPNSL